MEAYRRQNCDMYKIQRRKTFIYVCTVYVCTLYVSVYVRTIYIKICFSPHITYILKSTDNAIIVLDY